MDILIKGMEMPTKVNHPLFIRISSDGHIAKGDFLKGGFIETEAKAIEVAADRDIPMLIPKKDIHVDEFFCPNCGEELTIYCRVWQRYCPMCGQRIYEANDE